MTEFADESGGENLGRGVISNGEEELLSRQRAENFNRRRHSTQKPSEILQLDTEAAETFVQSRRGQCNLREHKVGGLEQSKNKQHVVFAGCVGRNVQVVCAGRERRWDADCDIIQPGPG